MSSLNQIKRQIKEDIKCIDFALQSNEFGLLKETHMMIDGKYQSKINTWGLSQIGWRDNHGFIYNYLDKEALFHNLQNMKSKLDGYIQDFSLKPLSFDSTSKNINVYNTNENNINNYISNVNFELIERQISTSESLTNMETKEALEKLNELRKVCESNESRKSKWEKIKSILIWLADKSIDIAIAFFPAIISILNQ